MADILYSRSSCIDLLRKQAVAIEKAGENRYPKRSDFNEDEVVAIKAFLGPWPRALEAAGLKPEREGKAERNREKRIAAKRKRNAARKAVEKQNKKEDSTK